MKDLNDPTNVDSVPAMLTPGEFVLNKEASQMYAGIIEQMNNHGLEQRKAENRNMGGMIPNYNDGGIVQGYNIGGWLKGLLKPDPNSVIGQQQAGNILPAHIRANPPGYGAAPPPPEFVPQAQPGQQVQGGFGPGIPTEFSGNYRPEQQPTYITDIPQVGSGAQHGRNTVIPSAASIPNIKGEQANLGLPAEPEVPKFSDEDLIQNSSESVVESFADPLQGYAAYSPQDFLNEAQPQGVKGGGADPSYDPHAGRQVQGGFGAEIPNFTNIPQAQEGQQVQGGFGAGIPLPEAIPQVGTGAQHGRSDIVTTNPTFDADRDGSYFTKTNDPLLKTQYDAPPEELNPDAIPSIFQGYENYTPEDALAEAQGKAPETDNVDWNSLQGLGIPQTQEEGEAVTAQVQDKIIKQQNNISDNILKSAAAESQKLSEQAKLAAENGEFERANNLTRQAQETITNAEAEAAANDEVTAGVQAKYEAGKQAKLDAENQWREAQGLPPKVEEIEATPPGFNPESKENVTETKAAVNEIVDKVGGDEPPVTKEESNAVVEASKTVSKQQVNEAKSTLKDTFGDLFNEKEFGRASLLFAGALLTGMSPQRALAFAGQGYVKRIDAKQDRFEQIALSGKYTPESVKAYKESGDVTTLVTPEVKSTLKQTGNFSTRYTPGGKAVNVQEVKDANGNVYFQDESGNIVSGFKTSGNSPKERATLVKTHSDVLKPQLKALRSTFDEFETPDGVKGSKTDVLPEIAAGKVAQFFVEEGVDPTQGASIVESAYHDMINDRRQDGSRARDIVPYLRQNIVRQRLGNDANAFVIKPASKSGPAQYVDPSKLAALNKGAERWLINNGAQPGTKDLANNFYTAALEDWNDLDEDTKQLHNKSAGKGENGFFDFAEQWLANNS